MSCNLHEGQITLADIIIGAALVVLLTLTLVSCKSTTPVSPVVTGSPRQPIPSLTAGASNQTSPTNTDAPTSLTLPPSVPTTPILSPAVPGPTGQPFAPTLSAFPSTTPPCRGPPAVARQGQGAGPGTPPSPPTPLSPFARTRYTLSARLDYAQHHLAVSQTLAYLNSSPLSLPELVFVVEPNRQPGVFNLKGLTREDGQPVAGYRLEGARLRLPLPTPLPPGKAITLSLSFELNLPAQAAPLGYTPRQTNLGDWYPIVPPYDAERGWLVHEPGGVGEHLVYDVADYRVDVLLASSSTDVIVAASGLAHWAAEGQTRYQLNAARSFAWSASHAYHVITGSVGPATVEVYVFPEHQVAGEAALEAVADALAVYSARFAPYPRAGLALVESEFPDGMEYDGLFFLGQEYFAGYSGDPQGYLTAIAVHEAAHQWWYGLVGNDQALEPWLDETLATYSELLFYETVYPGLTDWWWGFRVTRFAPAGRVNSTIYDHYGFRSYVNAVYLCGALFMQELRNLIGDEAFFAFLKDYARQGSLSQVTAADFFGLLARHTAADLKPLISRYFKP